MQDKFDLRSFLFKALIRETGLDKISQRMCILRSDLILRYLFDVTLIYSHYLKDKFIFQEGAKLEKEQ